MENFRQVNKDEYAKFVNWAGENLNGVHQYSIMVADRIVVKDANDILIAYVDLAYETTFNIKESVYDDFKNS